MSNVFHCIIYFVCMYFYNAINNITIICIKYNAIVMLSHNISYLHVLFYCYRIIYYIYYFHVFNQLPKIVFFIFRIKSFEFPNSAISFDIPKLLTLNDCGYRCLITKFDHCSPSSKSFLPRKKIVEEAPHPLAEPGTPICLQINI